MSPWHASRLLLAASLGGALLCIPVQAQGTPTAPDGNAAIEAAKAVVDAHAGPQSRMLRCLAATEPKHGALAIEDWNSQLGRARQALSEAAIALLAREILLAPVSVAALTAAGAGSEAELKASCLSNRDWEERWSLFHAHSFAGDIREALTGKR